MTQPPHDPADKGLPTRRDFLTTGAAVGAAASLPAASYARILGANERVLTGFIGVGNRGESLLKMVAKDCPEAQVTALCDVYEPYLYHARKHVAADAKLHSDHRKLLEDADLDAVVIATPDHWHAIQFIDACRAGKDVYVEKPLSLTVEEGRRMVDVARQTGRVAQMGAQRHSSPYIVEACRLMREGGIGKITHARCFHITNESPAGIGRRNPGAPPPGLDWDRWLGPAPFVPFDELIWNYKFRWFWPYSGGQMTNFGTHYIDVIQMAIGEDAPESVAALGGNFAVDDDRDIPDTMEALWRYKNCLVSFLQTNANAAPGSQAGVEMEFRGSEATLYITGREYRIVPESVQDGPYPSRGPLLRNAEPPRKTMVEAKTVRGGIDHAGHLRDFFASVRSRSKCSCDVETGHLSTTATLIANIAYRTRATLRWDREAERFTNHEPANRLLAHAYREPWTL
jgi:predicted dehydrogenase